MAPLPCPVCRGYLTNLTITAPSKGGPGSEWTNCAPVQSAGQVMKWIIMRGSFWWQAAPSARSMVRSQERPKRFRARLRPMRGAGKNGAVRAQCPNIRFPARRLRESEGLAPCELTSRQKKSPTGCRSGLAPVVPVPLCRNRPGVPFHLARLPRHRGATKKRYYPRIKNIFQNRAAALSSPAGTRRARPRHRRRGARWAG